MHTFKQKTAIYFFVLLKGFVPHYSLGFTLKDVQEWLGHSDIKMTANIYAHLDTA